MDLTKNLGIRSQDGGVVIDIPYMFAADVGDCWEYAIAPKLADSDLMMSMGLPLLSATQRLRKERWPVPPPVLLITISLGE